jgi:Flp pilus assembly protein TadD
VIPFPNSRITGLVLAAVVSGTACTTAPYTRTPPPVIERGVPAPARPAARGGEIPPAVVYPPSAPAPREQPAAVVALLDHAEQQANAGDLSAAAVTLERAIRIDSRNPILWHHLASVRLAEGELLQAEQLAAKSSSLAPGNYALQARNWGLIAAARHKRGDAAGALAAERQQQLLQAR